MQEKAASRFQWWRCILVLVVVIIIIVVGCWRFPKWCVICKPCDDTDCSDCTDKTDPVAQIILDDTRAASWMVIDNSFIEDKGVLTDQNLGGTGISSCGTDFAGTRVFGIMFQFGSFSSGEGEPVVSLAKLEITTSATPEDVSTHETKSLLPGEFDWVDVNGYGDCIIDATHGYSLFKNTLVRMECDDADCGADNACLRNRALHPNLKPETGLMTYWAGPSGYSSTAERNGELFGEYTFSLNESVFMDIWLAGEFLERVPNVIKIQISLPVDFDADGLALGDPPTDGGGWAPI